MLSKTTKFKISPYYVSMQHAIYCASEYLYITENREKDKFFELTLLLNKPFVYWKRGVFFLMKGNFCFLQSGFS